MVDYLDAFSNTNYAGPAEIFDPTAVTGSQWALVDAIPTPRRGLRALLLPDGKVMTYGTDYSSTSNTHDITIEIFDPAAASGSQWRAYRFFFIPAVWAV